MKNMQMQTLKLILNNIFSKKAKLPDKTTIQNTILKELCSRQAAFAANFLPTSEFFDKKDFYENATKFINTGRDDEIIIDVGCGDCRLIQFLKKYKPETTIIGIEINPFILVMGYQHLKKCGYRVNIHYGADIAVDPSSYKVSLISDIITQKKPFKFEKGIINLLHEDIRYAEVLRERLISDLKFADIITYTLPGGFSPHIILEKGKEKDYNSIKAGIELNTYVLAMGVELLKLKGRMIWAIRAGSQDPEGMDKKISLDDLNLSMFNPFYDINRVEILSIDEQKEKNLKLNLPAYAFYDNATHYTNDILTTKNDMKLFVILIEMILKKKI